MFDDQARNLAFDLGWDADSPGEFDVSIVIRDCAEIPDEIKTAEATHIYERVIDRIELFRLTNVDSIDKNNPELLERLAQRREALKRYLGSYLTCIYYRFPGVHYTIEIDPVSQNVVHWEWQAT